MAKKKKKRPKKKLVISDNDIERFRKYYLDMDIFEGEKTILTKVLQADESTQYETQVAAANFYGLEKGRWVANLSYSQYTAALSRMRKQISQEFDCHTSTEMMLADRIVACYWRVMRYETFFNRIIEKEGGGYEYDPFKLDILREFAKGIDKADRQLQVNITTLRQLKQPPLNVQIKTKNAFIAENQQINSNPPQDV